MLLGTLFYPTLSALYATAVIHTGLEYSLCQEPRLKSNMMTSRTFELDAVLTVMSVARKGFRQGEVNG